jgi:hypothetical protein
MILLEADFNNRQGRDQVICEWSEGVSVIEGDEVMVADIWEGFTAEGRIVTFDARTGLLGVVIDWSTLLWPDEVHMISEPSSDPPSAYHRGGSEYSPAHRFLRFLRWPDDPEAGSPIPRPREHLLLDRLAPYQASEVPSLFREASWSTLVYWQNLLDDYRPEPWAPAIRHLST